MAHARITLDRMMDWLTEELGAGRPAPSDAAIVDRFGFTSAESARSLLADLADAGRITIDWRSEPRTVTLGRRRSTFVPARPGTRSVVRREEDGSRVAVNTSVVATRPFAIETSLGGRSRSPRSPAAAPRTTPPATTAAPSPAPVAVPSWLVEDETMPDDPLPITFRPAGETLKAIKARAVRDNLSLARAALLVLEDALASGSAPAATPTPIVDAGKLTTGDLLEELGHRFDSGSPELVAAATARAEAAEGQLATIKTQLGLLVGAA